MTLRVLALEDSATRQRVLQIALAATAELHAFAQAEAAYDAALTLRPDVVLATCADAPADGYALCARLRGDARTASLPVLLLTTAQRPYDAARGAEVGATGHIERPCSAQALLEAVRAATSDADGRSAPRAARAHPPRPTPQQTRPQPTDHAPPPPQPADAAKAFPYPAPPPALPTTACGRTEDTAPPPRAPAAPPAGAQAADVCGWSPSTARPKTSLCPPPPAQTRDTSAQTAWPAADGHDAIEPWRALPPLPNWDAPPQPPKVAVRVGDAVAALLGRLAPELDGAALNAHVREVVEREVVAILWEVVPKLAERHILTAQARAPAQARPPGAGAHLT